MTRVGVLFAVTFVGVGCTLDPATPPEPMPTTGPNQVVIAVPGMT